MVVRGPRDRRKTLRYRYREILKCPDHRRSSHSSTCTPTRTDLAPHPTHIPPPPLTPHCYASLRLVHYMPRSPPSHAHLPPPPASPMPRLPRSRGVEAQDGAHKSTQGMAFGDDAAHMVRVLRRRGARGGDVSQALKRRQPRHLPRLLVRFGGLAYAVREEPVHLDLAAIM